VSTPINSIQSGTSFQQASCHRLQGYQEVFSSGLEEGALLGNLLFSSLSKSNRICPGRFFAEGVLWAAVVHILATLRFSKDKDANGRSIEIDPVFTNGVTS